MSRWTDGVEVDRWSSAFRELCSDRADAALFDALDQHFERVPSHAWRALSERIRGHAPPYVDGHVARALVERARGHTVALGLLAVHRSGWCREVAHRALAGVRDPRAVVFALNGCDDWVPEVREAAAAAATTHLATVPIGAVIDALPLFDALEARRRRHDHVRVVARARLQGELPKLVNAITSPDRRVARSALAWSLSLGADPAACARLALRSPDPRLAREALRAVEALPADVAAAALAHPSRLIRVWALELVRDDPAALAAHLGDRSASVRSSARFHLVRSGAWTREALREEARARTAHDRPTGREAAWMDLGDLIPSEADLDAMEEAVLLEPHPRPARAALRELLPHRSLDQHLSDLLADDRVADVVVEHLARSRVADVDFAALVTEATSPPGRDRALALLVRRRDALVPLLRVVPAIAPVPVRVLDRLAALAERRWRAGSIDSEVSELATEALPYLSGRAWTWVRGLIAPD